MLIYPCGTWPLVKVLGKKTDVIHRKMAEMCTAADLALISFKRDFSPGCPYSERKYEVVKNILDIDFTKPNKEITREINECYRSEKFYHEAVWCNKDVFETCKYKDECPVKEWKDLINNNETALPFRTEPKIFFYYDSLCFIKFLKDDWGFDWVEAAEITKSDENKVIQIRKGKNRAHIVLDGKKEKATLTINNNSKNLELRVKRQNGKLNVYKSGIFYDVCPNANFYV
jgi:hypothetical protein